MSFHELAVQLAEVGRLCYSRGWVLGTSGNFSAVVSREPLRLAITSSGVDKGLLTAAQIVAIDERGRVVEQGSGTELLARGGVYAKLFASGKFPT